jgi:hypothetical protein
MQIHLNLDIFKTSFMEQGDYPVEYPVCRSINLTCVKINYVIAMEFEYKL